MLRPKAVFTIGYEGRSLADFLADLHAHDVRLLVDVREAPISRKAGFSKSSLGNALNDAGMGYRHMRALGCPKAIRDAYKNDGDWARYTRAFMQHLDQQTSAVLELKTLVDSQSAALLCYEADFTRCHRTYVARAVAARSASVVEHITPAGLVQDPITPP
jgi:uncharacterized protein (DUF488 family)